MGRVYARMKTVASRTDIAMGEPMAVHVICPSLRCRKILTMSDDVRGTLVTCRYCDMQFRVPAPRRTPLPARGMLRPGNAPLRRADNA
jgi:hypothetical protein